MSTTIHQQDSRSEPIQTRHNGQDVSSKQTTTGSSQPQRQNVLDRQPAAQMARMKQREQTVDPTNANHQRRPRQNPYNKGSDIDQERI